MVDWSAVLVGFDGVFLFALGLLFGQAEERGDLRPGTVMVLPLFKLSLTFHRETGERKGLKAVVSDRLFAVLTHAVGPTLYSFERFVNLVKRTLFLGEHAQGKVTVVGITTGIGLMHSESGSLRSGMEIITGHASHGIEEGVLEFQKTLTLFCQERGEFETLVLQRLPDELLCQDPLVGVE